MRLFVFAFLVVFALGFATALVFDGLGTGAGLAGTAGSIAVILVMSVIGAAMVAPVPPRSTYLMDGPHWSVREGTQHPHEFADFFRALAEIAPPDSFLALADGAWDEEVRAAISKAASEIGDSLRVLPPLPQEFDRAVLSPDRRGIVPINGSHMAVFAGLAENHAPIEIAWHLAAFTRDGSWLEWFDLTDDPISISIIIPEDAVAKFADRIGREWMAVSPSAPAAQA